MREIKFRGMDKRGEWHYGYYYKIGDNTFIVSDHDKPDTLVKPETVGQLVNLPEQPGKDMYENDIVKFIQKKVFCKNEKCVGNDNLAIGTFCPDCGSELKREDCAVIAKIGFYDGGFCLCYFHNEYKMSWQLTVSANYIESIEIIGNNHENPELLGENANP